MHKAVFLALLVSCAHLNAADPYDLLLRNGTIYDGSGKAPIAGDLGINGDKIAAVGKLADAKGKTEFDVKGLAVAPGFINVLSWANESLLQDGAIHKIEAARAAGLRITADIQDGEHTGAKPGQVVRGPGWKGRKQPLIHAHAHNDYLHPRPLLDALDHGFCSVEADIFLVEGQLLVAHDRDKVNPNRTLQSLYLEPLRARVKQNAGRVYPNGPEFTLLIDLKSNWQTIYPALRAVLTNYSDTLTTFREAGKRTNGVLVIISGSRDRRMFDGETTRYAAFDGELSDLDTNPAPDFAPWISARWGAGFAWRGNGAMPDAEKQKLESIVRRAHEQGRRVRFWGAPDHPDFWAALRVSGVDLINTDDLAGLQKFLMTR